MNGVVTSESDRVKEAENKSQLRNCRVNDYSKPKGSLLVVTTRCFLKATRCLLKQRVAYSANRIYV